MKIYLTNQKNQFQKHLYYLKSKAVMEYDKTNLTEKISTIYINTTKNFDDLNLDFLFDYQIFPESILSYKTQWTDENRKIEIGDTIAQQVYIPPTKILSKKIVFGVRINEIIVESDKIGFSYETLEGHVEKGISTFTIEKLESRIIFKIQTYSKPGNILTKLLGPIFSVPYQAFCTKKALENVKLQIENQ